MKVSAIIQARMGSTRLPGKVLREIQGIPVLVHIINRLKKSKNIDEIIVATTINKNDDSIVEVLKDKDIKIYRGDENDVLDRYYNASIENDVDIIVRITSDDPLIDYNIVDSVIERMIKENTDYCCNNLPRTYPIGLDCECFTFKALKIAWENASFQREREHVTPYIREHEDIFSKSVILSNENYSNLRWTLDTKEDFVLINTIYDLLFDDKGYDFNMYDVLELYKTRPELKYINNLIVQKNV